jgi:hypothetical protein
MNTILVPETGRIAAVHRLLRPLILTVTYLDKTHLNQHFSIPFLTQAGSNIKLVSPILPNGGVAMKPSSRITNVRAMEVVELLTELKETVKFVKSGKRKRWRFKLHMTSTKRNCR